MISKLIMMEAATFVFAVSLVVTQEFSQERRSDRRISGG